MKLLIGTEIEDQIRVALQRAGKREVGGILMGENIGPNEFRLADLTVQMEGGTFARFVRAVEPFLGPLRAFFRRTAHDYRRFNYLGEWHSHHSFTLELSAPDIDSMLDLVTDREVGALFAVALLVRLSAESALEARAWAVTQNGTITPIALVRSAAVAGNA